MPSAVVVSGFQDAAFRRGRAGRHRPDPPLGSRVPYRAIRHTERLAEAEYVDWFKLHGEIGLVPPGFEANHWASITPEHNPQTPVPTGARSK